MRERALDYAVHSFLKLVHVGPDVFAVGRAADMTNGQFETTLTLFSAVLCLYFYQTNPTTFLFSTRKMKLPSDYAMVGSTGAEQISHIVNIHVIRL